MGDVNECERELRQVLRQSFTGAAADLVLEAHDCAAERFDEVFAENVRVADILLAQQADPVVIACIYPVSDISRKPVEFQIRTQAMHREAEYGIAAHWRYKSDSEAQAHHDRQVQWLQGLLSQRQEAANHEAFIEHLRQQVFGDGRRMNEALVIFAENPRLARGEPHPRAASPPSASRWRDRLAGESAARREMRDRSASA